MRYRQRSMMITVEGDDGELIEFDADTPASSPTHTAILQGMTYPFLPFVDDVQVVFDVGANCGATSVHFARHYPDAAIHAFEPAADAAAYLERNLERVPNASVHRFGFDATDSQRETVELRAAGPWARAQGIERIDILKLDAAGLEVDVLESLGEYLASVKVIYTEYESRAARRRIRDLVDATHELYIGELFLDQGDCIYLRKDFAALDVATQRLREIFVANLAASTDQRRGAAVR